jgi:hypothetical protein
LGDLPAGCRREAWAAVAATTSTALQLHKDPTLCQGGDHHAGQIQGRQQWGDRGAFSGAPPTWRWASTARLW